MCNGQCVARLVLECSGSFPWCCYEVARVFCVVDIDNALLGNC